ncbi:MAG: ATP-binding cassette domain-containing protein [Candidatus Peribacteraceae bacterium]|nr:ATP-binding cassette domain-containing protein [Candidatus Peribacteraceae bacterium]
MPANKNPLINVQHLNVRYFPGKSNEVHALKDINLQIYPGEFIVFFGPSGCGKSTLLYSISGLETNISGDVVIGGKNLLTMTQREKEFFHQKTVGMVFQAYYLIPSLSVLQNVVLPQIAVGGYKRTREEHGQHLLEQFGVGVQAGKLPTELSGGQQQRVAICRSVMNDPDIIFADEPVGNLDTKSSEEVMQLLRQLNDRDKKTVVLVTHDPSHLHHAHRVFFLRDGQITDVKENTEEERKESLVKSAARQEFSKDLRQWAKTLSPEQLSEEDLDALVSSQDVIAEAFAGLTRDEMATVQKAVQRLIQGRDRGGRKLLRLLAGKERDSLGLPVRKARAFTKQILGMALEMRSVKRVKPAGRLRAVRRVALCATHTVLRGRKAVAALDTLILRRMLGEIVPEKMAELLAVPPGKGGPGVRKTKARTLARKIEALLPAAGKVPLPEKKAAAPAPSPSPPDAKNPLPSRWQQRDVSADEKKTEPSSPSRKRP